MKKILFILVILVCSPTANAGGPFGLGLLLGAPTGITGKLWLNQSNAIDFATAWSMGSRSSFLVHGDYLWHTKDIFKVEKRGFDLHYGVGARLLFADDLQFGVRVPVGIGHTFLNPEIEIFIEIAAVVDLAPSTELDMNGGFGARFYF